MERLSLRVAKGSATDNQIYCGKDENVFTRGIPMKTWGGKREKKPKEPSFRDKLKARELDTFKDVKWKTWQQSIIDILDREPDNRKIHWIYEESGNVGKSFLAKYIACKYAGVIMCDGKKENILNQVNMTIEKEVEPKIILLDIPRTLEGKVHLGTVEQLKNGCVYSGKYEGGQCIFGTPHIIAFANFKPDMEDLSKDRWNLLKIK